MLYGSFWRLKTKCWRGFYRLTTRLKSGISRGSRIRLEQVVVFGVVFGTSADLAAFYISFADHILAHRRVLHTSAEAEISRGETSCDANQKREDG